MNVLLYLANGFKITFAKNSKRATLAFCYIVVLMAVAVIIDAIGLFAGLTLKLIASNFAGNSIIVITSLVSVVIAYVAVNACLDAYLKIFVGITVIGKEIIREISRPAPGSPIMIDTAITVEQVDSIRKNIALLFSIMAFFNFLVLYARVFTVKDIFAIGTVMLAFMIVFFLASATESNGEWKKKVIVAIMIGLSCAGSLTMISLMFPGNYSDFLGGMEKDEQIKEVEMADINRRYKKLLPSFNANLKELAEMEDRNAPAQELADKRALIISQKAQLNVLRATPALNSWKGYLMQMSPFILILGLIILFLSSKERAASAKDSANSALKSLPKLLGYVLLIVIAWIVGSWLYPYVVHEKTIFPAFNNFMATHPTVSQLGSKVACTVTHNQENVWYVTVPSTAKWCDTGIAVNSSQVVAIQYVSGTWTGTNQRSQLWTDADGGGQVYNTIVLDAPYCSLVGKAGNEGGKFVGNRFIGSFGTGNLFLSMNDTDTFIDNSGTVVVQITVSP